MRKFALPSVVLYFLLLFTFLTFSACVYFNTYYNAQKHFRKAEKARKKEESEQLGLGDSYTGRPQLSSSAKQFYEQSVHKASKVLEEFRESDLVDDAMFLIGRAFYWQGNYQYAIRTFNDLEDNFTESEFYDRARYWRALCYEAQGDLQGQELFRTLFSSGKGKIAYQSGYRMGEIAFAAEDYAVAIQEYQATLDDFPKAELRAELYLRLGEAIFALEDSSRYAEALAAFELVRRESPSRKVEYKARLNSGHVLYAKGDVEGALHTYTGLLKESRFRPFEGQTRLAVGQYYQDRHLLDEALDEYEQVRDDFPQSEASAMALYRTALLYLQGYGDTERAEEYFKEIRVEKSNSEAAVLGQQILRELTELDRFRSRIHRADSLAAVQQVAEQADSLVAEQVDSLVAVPQGDSARPDSSRNGEVAIPWFFDKGKIRVRKTGGARGDEVLEDLFSMAEIYRFKIEQPDSAAHYYHEIVQRFPDSNQILRALFAIAWVYLEMKEDMDAAKPYLEHIIEVYPSSEHANAARRYLGQEVRITGEELAAAEFVRIEPLWLQDQDALETYVPLLDSLSRHYPATHVAAKAAFMAAWQYENIRGDTLESESRFERLLAEFPDSQFADLVIKRRENRSAGVLAKLERSLKSVGGNFKPGERIDIIAVEPDSVDSVALARKHFRFALRAYNRGDLKAAREQCELSLEQKARNPDAHYYLGSALWEEGYRQDAMDHYYQVLHYDGNHLGAHYRLSTAYTVEGIADSANHYLRQIVNRDRQNYQVQFLLEEHPELRGADAEELDLYDLESLELYPPQDNLALRQKELRLEELPLVRHMVLPDYPVEAAEDSAEVILDILVGRDGRPEMVEVFKGEPPFSEAAVDAARDYVFYPATVPARGRDREKNEEKVRVWVELAMPVRPRISADSREDRAVAVAEMESVLPDSTFQDTVSALPELPHDVGSLEAEQE